MASSSRLIRTATCRSSTFFEPFDRLAISLHTSGPLMMWLAERHPEYIRRLRTLVDAGRVEIVGGPQYEPIMTMLPRRDRIGQIRSYSQWLKQTLGRMSKVCGP